MKKPRRARLCRALRSGGDGGDRTRVRKTSTPRSTCLAPSIFLADSYPTVRVWRLRSRYVSPSWSGLPAGLACVYACSTSTTGDRMRTAHGFLGREGVVVVVCNYHFVTLFTRLSDILDMHLELCDFRRSHVVPSYQSRQDTPLKVPSLSCRVF